ncbi:hypothetical protein D1007_19402 [Hordeum vulgare]|nr:hypothetical protein D1007_19402 [Hordeum vulgare]
MREGRRVLSDTSASAHGPEHLHADTSAGLCISRFLQLLHQPLLWSTSSPRSKEECVGRPIQPTPHRWRSWHITWEATSGRRGLGGRCARTSSWRETSIELGRAEDHVRGAGEQEDGRGKGGAEDATALDALLPVVLVMEVGIINGHHGGSLDR